ncbi:MAG: hypothetical protein E7213_00220, partial [Clostridium sp.]|nr:hypothetical protein [Clostridium sp.]
MKKKILSAIISGVIMTTTITCSIPQMTVIANAATTYGTVTGDSVNIRQSASTSSKSLGKLNKGVRVEILSSTNGWYKIKYGNIIGYMSSQYVRKDSPASTETAFNRTGYVKVTTTLNVRKSASTNAASLGKLGNGTKVDIVAKTTDNKWYKIRFNGGFGYVSTDYVTLAPVVTETAFNRTGYVKVVSTPLNVRKSPSTNAASLGKLGNNTKIDIVAKTTDNKWYKIRFNGGFGYVSADYVTFTAPAPVVTETAFTKTG